MVEIAEVQGMEGDVIMLAPIFEFQQTGFEAGRVVGQFRTTGLRPRFIDRFVDTGINLPPRVFGIGS